MAKTKTLISCAVTALLICVFVFAYANCWFSYAKAHIDCICSDNVDIVDISFLIIMKTFPCNIK